MFECSNLCFGMTRFTFVLATGGLPLFWHWEYYFCFRQGKDYLCFDKARIAFIWQWRITFVLARGGLAGINC